MSKRFSFVVLLGGLALFPIAGHAAAPQTRASQFVSFNPSSPAIAGTSAKLAATASSGLPVVFEVRSASPQGGDPGVCAINGDQVTYKKSGDCNIYASQAGDETYAGPVAVLQTIVVVKAAQAISFRAPPAAASAQTSAPLEASASPSGLPVSFSIDPASASICSLSGAGAPTTVIYNKQGDCRISVDQAGDATYEAAPRVTQTVRVSLITAAIRLASSAPVPAPGQRVVLTATIAPAGVGAPAATGSVTFRDGAQTLGSARLAGGVATFTTQALALGDHVMTAAYGGDEVYGALVSAPLVLSQNRPNPADDSHVRAIVAAQAAMTRRMADTQIDTVQRRLEALHGEDTPAFLNGLSVSGPRDLPRGAGPFDDPVLKDQAFTFGAAGRALDRWLGASFGTFEPLPVKVWTAGSVMTGGANFSSPGVVTKTHLTLSGLTAGVDAIFMQGVKGGFAVSYSGGANDLGDDGSRMKSRGITGSLYGSWRVKDRVFLDGLVGYGDMAFSSRRYEANATGLLAGERRGKLFFGSLALSYDAALGPLKLAPYGRLDLMNASLNAYAETGDANWTLNFDKATLSSQSLALGLRGEYGIEQPWGLLSPTGRLEYRRLMSGELTQAMGYAAQPSDAYALTTAPADRDMVSASLGLKAKGAGDVTGSLEYLLSGGLKSGLQGQGLRGAVRVGF